MDRQERLAELKKLGNIHGNTTSSDSVFSAWQGRISALLSYDPIAKHKFDHSCDYILEEHDFDRGLISHEVVEATKKIHALIERAIADLEINVPAAPKAAVREGLSVDAFGPVVQLPKLAAPPKKEVVRKDRLNSEEGLLWFWHHCHYSIKWRVIYSGLPLLALVFFLGWKANKYSFFQKVGGALHEVFYGESSFDDEVKDPKKPPK